MWQLLCQGYRIRHWAVAHGTRGGRTIVVPNVSAGGEIAWAEDGGPGCLSPLRAWPEGEDPAATCGRDPCPLLGAGGLRQVGDAGCRRFVTCGQGTWIGDGWTWRLRSTHTCLATAGSGSATPGAHSQGFRKVLEEGARGVGCRCRGRV